MEILCPAYHLCECVTHPQCRPITSRTKVRWWLWRDNSSHTEMEPNNSNKTNCTLYNWEEVFAAGWSHVVSDLCAVVMIASIMSMMRCSAESAPMVMSVPQKSLSMEPTRPTMFRCLCCLARVSVILPEVAHECHWTCADCTRNNATVATSHQWCLLGRGWNVFQSTISENKKSCTGSRALSWFLYHFLISCFGNISDFHPCAY